MAEQQALTVEEREMVANAEEPQGLVVERIDPRHDPREMWEIPGDGQKVVLIVREELADAAHRWS